MSREIKFRFWNKKNNTMYYGEDHWHEGMWYHITGSGDVYASNADDTSAILDDDVIPLQYTDKKDKNGKEIYEGDILKHYDEFAFLGEPKEFVRQVKWDTYYGASWNFGISYKDGDKRWSYPQPDDCEVIGNIYENPELLEGNKND